MRKSSLPNQIIVLGTIGLFAVLVILWISLISVREAMDIEAADQSRRLMKGRIETLQEQVSLIASDYHNWTDLFLSATNLSYSKLASNYGITAERGDIFQYAELFDGPFPTPISWRKEQGLKPQEGFLSDFTRIALRESVPGLDASARQTVDYFGLQDDQLVMFSGSYLLPEDPELLTKMIPNEQAIAIIGKIVTRDRLVKIGSELSVQRLRVVDTPSGIDTVSIPLIGISGQSIASLEWKAPTPGTVLYRKMIPIMAVLSLLLSSGFFWAAKLLKDKASELVDQEAISFEQARTDALTGLPNRLALREHLENISSDGTISAAMLIIDLDRFKQVNDLIGHVGGDLFLEKFAKRLRLLSCDKTFVARVGGDEFVLVLVATRCLENQVRDKTADLHRILDEPIVCNGLHFDALASKGLAILEKENFCSIELIRRADRALYAAKALGTQKVVSFDRHMEDTDRRDRDIENRLRTALVENNGFYIEYQPIVSASSDNIQYRFEALARWHCSKLGEVGPEEFIRVAESSELIVRLGWKLLDLICRDIRNSESYKFSINVSPCQLMTPGFADLFEAKVRANDVQPSQIEIEVTEQIVARDDVTIARELTLLRNHGFSLALDDFGTGYSSLAYLTRMPFDVLKIDRSFAKLGTSNEKSRRMVHSIIELGHAMGLAITAEGIETLDDAKRFQELGVDFLQGFYFGKPSPMPGSGLSA